MNALNANEALSLIQYPLRNRFTSERKMDISEYLKLQNKRRKYKEIVKSLMKGNLTDLLRKYEKSLITKIDKLLKSGTLTVSNLDDVLDKFIADLTLTTEETRQLTSKEFIELHEAAKRSLDVKYKVEYQLFPKHIPDSGRMRSEIQSIIDLFRDNKLTEIKMKRLVRKRLRIPAHTAYTITNTQIAGLDNTASKAIADLALLEDGLYDGPTGNSREFCEERVGKIYTMEEIAAMDNGQGLPVIRYCGGYNCLHDWIWVDISWKEMKEFLV